MNKTMGETQYSRPKFWKTITFRIVAVTVVLLSIIMIVLNTFNSRLIQRLVEDYYSFAAEMIAELVTREAEDYQNDLLSFADSDLAQTLQALCTEYELNDVRISISSPPYVNAYEIIYISRNHLESREGDVLLDFEYEVPPEERSIFLGEKKTAHDIYSFSGNSFVSYMQGVYDSDGNCIAVCGVEFLETTVISNVERSVIRSTRIIGCIILAVLVILTLLLHFLIVSPVRKISQSMRSLVQGDNLIVQKPQIKGEDELSMMAEDFNAMTDAIQDYVQTKENVNTAAQIQKGMLPEKQFENESLKIEALMIPAREVGGDFYDYFPLNDGRMCFVIADVSDKGISAALFMASSVNCIRYNARLFSSPAQILQKVNTDVVSHNPELFFVTVFLAVYDPASGRLTCSNAGHNPPYLLSGSESGGTCVHLLNQKPGLVIGLYDNETYQDTTYDIRPDDILFLYTDGVNEAVSPDKEFFGNARLEESLIRAASGSDQGKSFPEAVVADIEAFSAGTEQHDDITILSVTFKNEDKT